MQELSAHEFAQGCVRGWADGEVGTISRIQPYRRAACSEIPGSRIKISRSKRLFIGNVRMSPFMRLVNSKLAPRHSRVRAKVLAPIISPRLNPQI